MNEFQERMNRLADKAMYGELDLNVGLNWRDRQVIKVALEIAEAALRLHDNLIACAEGNGNIITDAAETSNEIYKGAERYKYWRDLEL